MVAENGAFDPTSNQKAPQSPHISSQETGVSLGMGQRKVLSNRHKTLKQNNVKQVNQMNNSKNVKNPQEENKSPYDGLFHLGIKPLSKQVQIQDEGQFRHQHSNDGSIEREVEHLDKDKQKYSSFNNNHNL